MKSVDDILIVNGNPLEGMSVLGANAKWWDADRKTFDGRQVAETMVLTFLAEDHCHQPKPLFGRILCGFKNLVGPTGLRHHPTTRQRCVASAFPRTLRAGLEVWVVKEDRSPVGTNSATAWSGTTSVHYLTRDFWWFTLDSMRSIPGSYHSQKELYDEDAS